MQFRCDQCGKRYSTSQEIREGRSYRFQCRRCGHEVIVRGGGAEAATAAPSPPISAPASASASSPTPASASPRPAVAVRPDAFGPLPAVPPPPPGGYVDFLLDDAVVTSQRTTSSVLTSADSSASVPAASPAPPPPPPGPADAPSTHRPEPALPAAAAPPPGRHKRLGVVMAILVPALLAGLAVATLSPGGGPKGSAEPAAAAPGLLQPMVYVGPVALEHKAVEEPAQPPRPATRPQPRPAREPVRVAATKPARRATRPAAAEEVRTAPAAPAPGQAVAPAAGAAPASPAPAPPGAAPEPTSPPPSASGPVAATTPAAPDDRGGDGEAGEDEAPRYGGEGFRRPEPETPRCVESNLRLPRDLAGRLPPAVTLRFAVGRDGAADRIQVLGENVDPRLSGALQAAVRGCRFRPGADEAGRPIRLWVVMPLRFAP